MLADRTLENFIQWNMSMMSVIKKKPCETTDSNFNTVLVLLYGKEVSIRRNVKGNRLVRLLGTRKGSRKRKETNEKLHMWQVTLTNRLKKCKQLLKSCFPRCSGQRQVSCLRNCIHKSSKRVVKEHLRQLRDLVSVKKEVPNDASPLEVLKIVDEFVRMMSLKWKTKFHEAREEQFRMIANQICDYFQHVETTEVQYRGSNKSKHNKNKEK